MKLIKNIILSLRPVQWSKNLIIFAGIFFAGGIYKAETMLKTVYVFIIFCLLSGALYIINDIIDSKRDIHMEAKKKRPIAKGELNSGIALFVSLVLIAISIVWSFTLSQSTFIFVLIFFALHILYDFVLKHVAIVDIFSIALSFLIRLFAGMSILAVNPIMLSSWILLCTIFLSLLLALCKRRSELILLADNSKLHRRSLEGYNEKYLDQLITIMAGASILGYSLYTLSPETVANHGNANMQFTIPFVIFGIFRYLYLVYLKGEGLQPEKLLIKDIPFLLNMILYVACVFFIIYK